MITLTLSRQQVLGHRVRAQQLDRHAGGLDDTAVLDLGVQDTGPDGARWALAVRGLDISAIDDAELVTAWTLRGAPHVYRRRDLPSVARAVEPFSDADAGKRIYDASKPLGAAGIGNLEALHAVAGAMREVVTAPTVKGEVSSALTSRMDAPYLRHCRPCGATHLFEMPFRLAALRAGLELQPGTSPPVLQRLRGFRPAPVADPRHDVVRAYLHLLGPATPKHVAAYLDAPVADVKRRWPDDVVEVAVAGQVRWALSDDAGQLTAGPARSTRLLGPYDLYLQARDRELLVEDPARTKQLWPVLGRPGAVLVDGELAGTWRPRQKGARLTLEVAPWTTWSAPVRAGVEEQAARLADVRGVPLSGLDVR